jgi:hypothetical protein
MRSLASGCLPVLGACAGPFMLGGGACLFLLGGCACLFSLGGCASTAVVTRADELEQIVAAATQRGARECAPKELALAKVNLEFARLELSEGDRRRADHHLTLAEPNAKAALRVASDGKCKAVAVPPSLAAGPDEGAP